MQKLKSYDLYQDAQNILPGGVNSPVRAFKNVALTPKFIESGRGAYLYDVDGNAYIDFVGSFGPLILGNAHPYVQQKVSSALTRGFTFGACTEIEVLLAQKVKALMPAIEMIRFVSSGTEAAMSAIRLARGVTQRDKILKFAGCYHGHADSLLVEAGSGALTFGVPTSAGIPDAIAAHTLVAAYNDIESVKSIFAHYGEQIAAIIVEPVAANMNLVLPLPTFLSELRAICDQYGALLIFDEVITGFRIALGGAQSYYHITPDLTLLGKIVGGGFPAAAFGGRRDVMEYLAPLGPVYQAGTLSGNPIAMTAGLATLECLTADNFYPALQDKTDLLVNGLRDLADRANMPLHVANIASLFGLFFTDQTQISNETSVRKCDAALFKKFFHHMFDANIYLAPSPYEVGFVSSAHGDHEISQFLSAAEATFARM